MPDLFPSSFSDENIIQEQKRTPQFGKSFKFDFKTGEFALSPAGKFVETRDAGAWVEWCQKALMTARYRYLVYDDAYGQEFDSLIGQGLTRLAVESEIKRMATECLKAHPMTAKVTNFIFSWGTDTADTVFFSCDISNTLGETANISGSAVIA